MKVSQRLLQRRLCDRGIAGCTGLAVGLLSLLQDCRGLPYRVLGASAPFVELVCPVRDRDRRQGGVLDVQVVHSPLTGLGVSSSLVSLCAPLLQVGRGSVHLCLGTAGQNGQPPDIILQGRKSRHVLAMLGAALTSQLERRSLRTARQGRP